MLEHMARSRALRDHQAADSPAALEPSRKGAGDYLSGFISHMVLFGLIGLVFQSRFPLCLGAFLFFTDGEFVEWMLRKFGIRFEPDTIGPDVIRCFAFFFGWGMLLAYGETPHRRGCRCGCRRPRRCRLLPASLS